MSANSRTTWTERKREYVAWVIFESPFTYEEKAALLWLLRLTDENGHITNPNVNAMLDEAFREEGTRGS